MSNTSLSAIFCLDWMNAGSTGKALSNATLSSKLYIFCIHAHYSDFDFNSAVMCMHAVQNLLHSKERTAFGLVSRQVGMT